MGLINRMAESIRSGIKNFLQITPASDKTITVTETSNHLTECFINRIWYWGNSRQLAELYRQIDTNKTMFWAAKSTKGLAGTHLRNACEYRNCRLQRHRCYK